MLKNYLLIVFSMLCLSISGQVKTIYVSTTGSDSNTGEENSPYETLQFAVDKSISGDSIKVASGTYTENIIIHSKEVHIFSISGSESTIIDGNKSGRCVDIRGNTGNITFEGFSLKNGLANDGGGILISSSNDTIKISKIKIYSNQSSHNGGGMYIGSYNSSIIRIDACRFSENETTRYGGGIFASGDNIIFTNCLIDNNFSQTDGGGLWIEGKIKMINNTITKNSLSSRRYGSGILIDSGLDSLLLMNNVIYGNRNATAEVDVRTGKLVIYNNYLPHEPNNVKSEGNIVSYDDPFKDSENGDFSLKDNTSAIGSGIISVTLEGETYFSPERDFDMNTRPMPSGTNPDMGIFENRFGEPLSPPTDIAITNNLVNDNMAIGTEIGVLSSIDANLGDTHTYSLVSGDGDSDNNSFSITGNKLLSAIVFNSENKISYSIRVQTKDNNEGTFSKILRIADENTTYIPDDNFEEALIDLKYDDVLDDYVLNKNISSIKNLDLSSLDIRSLKGIEGFVNLEYLDIHHNYYLNNNIELSSNTKLFSLIAYQCWISELDLKNNTNLEILNLNTNSFYHLDVSNNLNLKTLWLGYNRSLNSVTFGNNTKLESLGLGHTAISELNLQYLILLKDLSISEAPINELDLSNNLNLEKLSLYITKVNSLDLTNNNKLIELSSSNGDLKTVLLPESSLLETVYLKNNRIYDIDFKKNNKINIIKLENNKLQSLNIKNGANSIISTFTVYGNPSLQCIQVDNAENANSGTGVYANWTKDDTATYSEDCSSLGIDDEKLAAGLNLYPNPTAHTLVVASKIPVNKVEIYSILGKKIKEKTSNFTTISTQSLVPGMYIIKVYSEKGTTVRKFIKK